MEKENFCAFISTRESEREIKVLYYVYETMPKSPAWRSVTFSRMHFVTEGEGVLHTSGGDFPLKAGDVFILQPGMPYRLDCGEGMCYIYVSCVGERVTRIEEMLGVSPSSCVFRDKGMLEPLFRGGIGLSSEMLRFYGEGVFLTTAAVIGEAIFAKEESDRIGTTAAAAVKREVDERFSDPDLTLESICRRLGYSPKYISSAFRSENGVTFREYLIGTRVNNALALMDKGFVSIKHIASLSGFTDPLYFSKVFKERMGITPTERLAEVKKKNADA